MKFEQQNLGDRILIRAEGQIDRVINVDAFRQGLEQAPDNIPIHIDLAEVEFVGSAFIKLLMEFRGQYPRKAANIQLVNPRPNTRDLLHLLKLDQVFPVLSTKPPCS